jgi:hypothetical protein
MSLSDTVRQYLDDPTPETYQEVREQIAASPNYAPYASAAEQAQPLLAQAKYAEAVTAVEALMPGAFLSPGAHVLLAHAHENLGNEPEHQAEMALAAATITGLLQTGDGTFERPYQALYLSDEYDVLYYLGKKSKLQSLVRRENRNLDQHTCDDGQTLWFDVSLFFANRPKAGA